MFRPLNNIVLAALVLAALCTLPVLQPAAAEVYRWTDINGRVQYGERPPSDASATRMDITSEDSPRVSDNEVQRRERQRRLLEAFEHERRQRRQAEAESAQRESDNARRCARLKAEWRRLSLAVPVYVKGDDGGREYLGDDRRAQYKARLVPAYRDACGEAPR